MKKKPNVQQGAVFHRRSGAGSAMYLSALRFYDKINIISPDYICEENKYQVL